MTRGGHWRRTLSETPRKSKDLRAVARVTLRACTIARPEEVTDPGSQVPLGIANAAR